jgi:cytochrome c oxidase assembly factor CtaG
LWLSYAGLVLAGLSVVSPLQFWSMQYFWVHMLQHVAVMLAAPAFYVLGAPVMPLVHAIPVTLRRRWLKRIFLRPTRHPLRVIAGFLISPIFAVVFFNVVMVVWMIPAIFNPVMATEDLHIGLMLSTFFLSGMLFWFQFIPSAPFRPTLQPFGQAAALVLTNWIMTIIAIVISFFTNVPLYKFGVAMGAMSRMVGMAMPVISLNRFADQQIGAAILWVCGDFWCFPAVYIAFRRSQSDDNGTDFVTKFLRRHRNMSVDEFTAARERSDAHALRASASDTSGVHEE